LQQNTNGNASNAFHGVLSNATEKRREEKSKRREEYIDPSPPKPAAGDTRFDAAWAIYPPRAGGNSRADARKAWSARVASGIDPDLLLAGVERYAAYIHATGKENTEFVKTGATFLGPGEHWRETWTLPAIVVTNGNGTADPHDDDAWREALEAVAQLSRGSLTSDDYAKLPAAVRAGFKRVGGWTAIRDARQPDMPFRRKDFLAGYHSTPTQVSA
jgi:hypothetical protein